MTQSLPGPMDQSEQIDVNQAILNDLRWGPDRVILNHSGERVWLKQMDGYITDCCFEDAPCDRHKLLGSIGGKIWADPVYQIRWLEQEIRRLLGVTP